MRELPAGAQFVRQCTGTITINGLKERYEDYHFDLIADETVIGSVQLTIYRSPDTRDKRSVIWFNVTDKENDDIFDHRFPVPLNIAEMLIKGL